MTEKFIPKTIEELIGHLTYCNYQGQIQAIAVTFLDNNGSIQNASICANDLHCVVMVTATELLHHTMLNNLIGDGQTHGIPRDGV